MEEWREVLETISKSTRLLEPFFKNEKQRTDNTQKLSRHFSIKKTNEWDCSKIIRMELFSF